MKLTTKIFLASIALVTVLMMVSCVRDAGVDPTDPAAQRAAAAAFEPASPTLAARGRILAVLTSTAHFGEKKKNAGYELTELARAWYVFRANGYDVEFASPAGGAPPVNVDEDDMQALDYAFLNDSAIQARIGQSLPLAAVQPERYAAIFFVGGKGALLDFPEHPEVLRLVKYFDRHGVVGGVCHGPAALLNVQGDDGKYLVSGRRMTGFSNAEELFLIKNARQVFSYLLQDKAIENGAVFVEAPRYTENVVVDGNWVTGQNPWSTWGVAEAMIRRLGHEPFTRARTPEELSVDVLGAYYRHGLDSALKLRAAKDGYDPGIIRLHALVAVMDGEWGEGMTLLRLAGL